MVVVFLPKASFLEPPMQSMAGFSLNVWVLDHVNMEHHRPFHSLFSPDGIVHTSILKADQVGVPITEEEKRKNSHRA